ncbi:hypothetical protein ACJX0J_008145 [Zea mays]
MEGGLSMLQYADDTVFLENFEQPTHFHDTNKIGGLGVANLALRMFNDKWREILKNKYFGSKSLTQIQGEKEIELVQLEDMAVAHRRNKRDRTNLCFHACVSAACIQHIYTIASNGGEELLQNYCRYIYGGFNDTEKNRE